MIGRLDLTLALVFVTVLGGAAALAFQLSKMPLAARPTLGARGLNRSRALRRGGIFAWFEPTIRLLAAWLALLGIERLRKRARRSLSHAGDYLGLCADELIALCLLSGFGFGVAVLMVCQCMDLPRPFAIGGLCLGAVVPWFRVLGVAQARARGVGRGLPGAVDLASMCMSAGLDFPGSLRRIVDSPVMRDALDAIKSWSSATPEEERWKASPPAFQPTKSVSSSTASSRPKRKAARSRTS